MNEILLRRKNKLLIPRGSAVRYSKQCLAAFMKNIEGLGYTFSQELYELLKTYTQQQVENLYTWLIPVLQKMVGANVVYRPMYPNFPKSIMRKSETELYLNAMLHYWSGGTIYPFEQADPRGAAGNRVHKLVELKLGTEEDLEAVIKNLISSKTSLSDHDKSDITWYFQNREDYFYVLPEEIPHKENAALVSGLLLKQMPLVCAQTLKHYIRTATDVLRLAVSLSDGDISLAEPTRFISFRRKERRILLELLEDCAPIEEDMSRYRNRWVRLGERLHPGEYQCYTAVNQAFYKLRNGCPIYSFRSKVSMAAAAKEPSKALGFLLKRPGELARSLDDLLRDSQEPKKVLRAFRSVADQVSSPVLLQVKEHFTYRNYTTDGIRVFFPKGNVARVKMIAGELPPIAEEYCEQAAEICEGALVRRYREKEALGKVYLSEDWKGYLIPFSQRSAGKALKMAVRGSRLPLAKDSDTIRGFIWWTNMKQNAHPNRVDLDLSAAIFDSHWSYMEHISYTRLRSDQYRAYHSGDIVNGGPADGEGAAEFIDIDIPSVIRYGGRYVVFQIYSYTRQIFDQIPNCMFGWMEREGLDSGEIFEPHTVFQKLELGSKCVTVLPAVFDCLSREVIWCDLDLTSMKRRQRPNNLENNLDQVAAACYALSNLVKPNLYDLIELHIKARGERTIEKAEADHVFDLDVIMGEYL